MNEYGNKYVDLYKYIKDQLDQFPQYSKQVDIFCWTLYVCYVTLSLCNLLFLIFKVRRLKARSFYLIMSLTLQFAFIFDLLEPMFMRNIRTNVANTSQLNIQNVIKIEENINLMAKSIRAFVINSSFGQFFLNIAFMLMEIKYWVLARKLELVILHITDPWLNLKARVIFFS